MLTFGYTAALTAAYNATKGLMVGAGTVARQIEMKLADGTAAGQADGIFTANTAVEGGSVDGYNLAAGLRDLYGDQLEFTAIKFLMVEADPANTSDLVVGGGTWPGLLGSADATVVVSPGDSLVRFTTSANGWSVDPAADFLPIASDDDAAYKLTIVGVSSALSAPAAAMHPEIIGTPRVGSETDCTAGDWSGAPAFAYQWLRAGQVIAGATLAAYTPVAADLGKVISRRTTAANIAGSVSVSTAPVQVQAAQAGVSDLSLDNPGPGLSAVL